MGLLLVPLNVYWIAQMERNRQTAFPTVFSLFFNAVFALLVLRGLNSLVRRIRPRLAFRPAELLLVYSMICISSSVSGIDFIQTLMPLLSYSFWMAGPENKWETILNPHFPSGSPFRTRRCCRATTRAGRRCTRRALPPPGSGRC